MRMTSVGVTVLPNTFAILPTIWVLSDSSVAKSREAGMTTNQKKKDPPTKNAAANR